MGSPTASERGRHELSGSVRVRGGASGIEFPGSALVLEIQTRSGRREETESTSKQTRKKMIFFHSLSFFVGRGHFMRVAGGPHQSTPSRGGTGRRRVGLRCSKVVLHFSLGCTSLVSSSRDPPPALLRRPQQTKATSTKRLTDAHNTSECHDSHEPSTSTDNSSLLLFEVFRRKNSSLLLDLIIQSHGHWLTVQTETGLRLDVERSIIQQTIRRRGGTA
jgi:hypothetical protein